MSASSSASPFKTPLLIIGAGPAGYTAAIYGARAGLKPTLLTGYTPGGQLTITTDVENYPGFRDAIQGPFLMEEMKAQAERFGTTIIFDTAQKIETSAREKDLSAPLLCRGDEAVYTADTLIIATGASAKWLNIPREDVYKGFGVSACATCDGFFFKDKHVLVVGGGNTAVEEALFLSRHAARVTMIHRRDQLRAEKILQERLFENPKIEVLWNLRPFEIHGKEEEGIKAFTGLEVEDTQTQARKILGADGLFVAIGHQPNTAFLEGTLPLGAGGYILPPQGTGLCDSGQTATTIPGLFAAGDVRDPIYRQAVTAASMGCMAALDAEHFLSFRRAS